MSLRFRKNCNISITHHEVTIPFNTDGTIIYCDTRTPTQKELEALPHIHLSSPHDWDPHDIKFPCVDHDGDREDSVIRTDFPFQGTVFDQEEVTKRIVASVQIDEAGLQPEFFPRTDIPAERTFISKERRGTVTAQSLSERWFIGLSQAKKTLASTTQRMIRSAILPMARRYRADRMFERPRIKGVVYTDTMDGQYKSLDGNGHAQVFANKDFFAVAYPIEKKSGAGDALKQFISDYGVPDTILCDGLKEQTGKRTTFRELVRKHAIDLQVGLYCMS